MPPPDVTSMAKTCQKKETRGNAKRDTVPLNITKKRKMARSEGREDSSHKAARHKGC